MGLQHRSQGSASASPALPGSSEGAAAASDDADVARRLQMEADAEAALHATSDASHPQQHRSQGLTFASQGLPGGDDRQGVAEDMDVARRLQLEADTEAALRIAGDGDVVAGRNVTGDEEIAWRFQMEADAELEGPTRPSASGQQRRSVQPAQWAPQENDPRRMHRDTGLPNVAHLRGRGLPNARPMQDMRRTVQLPRGDPDRLGLPNPRSLASDPRRATEVLNGMRQVHGLGRRRRPQHSEDSSDGSEWEEHQEEFTPAVPGANARQVANTTAAIRFSRSDPSSGGEQCNICCENYTDGEELRVLPCMHRFHKACVDRWLAQSRTCPICKHDISR